MLECRIYQKRYYYYFPMKVASGYCIQYSLVQIRAAFLSCRPLVVLSEENTSDAPGVFAVTLLP